MGKIYYYTSDGKLQNEFEIDKDILENAISLMSRCYLKNGNAVDGYIDPEDLKKRNILKLWTQEYDVVEDWEVNYDDIEKIECILASHPMWGHKMMNKFEFDKPNLKPINDEKHFYIYVEYIDMSGDKMYCYTSDDESIKKDDYVLVKRNNFEIPAKVINTVYYSDDDAPYPYSKLKTVIKKLPKNYKYYFDQDQYYDDEDYGYCYYYGVDENEYIKFNVTLILIGKYEYVIYRATDNKVIKEEEKYYAVGFNDEKFDKLLDKIKENNIDRWDKEYKDNKKSGEEIWNLSIKTKNLKMDSHGDDAYPKNYDTLIHLLDLNGIPIDEYYSIDKKMYEVTDDEEHDFISYFDKDVVIVFKDGNILSGHCDTFTRKEDSDYNEPELTIASKKGYIGVNYSAVLMIISELDRIKYKDGRIGTVKELLSNSSGLKVVFDDTTSNTETIDIKDVKEVLKNEEKTEKAERHKLKYNKILKADFLKIKEENLIFITNPGRMGDEDGTTFIIKNNNEFIVYRISGWMYGSNKDKKFDISLDDALNQFPSWHDAWNHGTEDDYKGKYTHLYMGFGNGLSIDNSIYSEFKPYLDIAVKKNLEQYSDDKEKEEMKYAAIFNVWEEAFINMANDKKYKIK